MRLRSTRCIFVCPPIVLFAFAFIYLLFGLALAALTSGNQRLVLCLESPAPLLGLILVRSVFYALDQWMQWWAPWLPPCRGPSCPNSFQRDFRPYLTSWICFRCGTRYQRIELPSGTIRFHLINNGIPIPYLERRPFRRWRPDRTPLSITSPYRTPS